MADYICKSLDTAIASVAEWLEIDSDTIVKILKMDLKSVYENDSIYLRDDFCDFLLHHFIPNGSQQKKLPRVHWFHGTRCLNPESFNEGIFPLNDMLPILKDVIDKIASKNKIYTSKKMTKYERDLEYLMSVKKESLSDQGPLAFLNYDTATRPKLYDCCDYTDMPEIIYDYAHVKYGDKAELLLQIYKEISIPTIVEFWAYPNGPNSPNIDSIVGTTLSYVYACLHPEEDSFGLSCNTCYSGYGCSIPPEQIVNIITLK